MNERKHDKAVVLSDLLESDRGLLQEICESYVETYGVAVKILDDRGNRIIQAGEPAAICQHVYSHPNSRKACLKIVSSLVKDRLDFQTAERKACFTGAQYYVVPIHNLTDVIGKLIFGPFLNEAVGAPPAEFLRLDSSVDEQTVWAMTQQLQTLDTELAGKLAQSLATLIELLGFVRFKSRLTTDMHVQSITEAYQELSRKHHDLEEKLVELERLNRQRASFLASISKELSSPLTNVIGYAEMLLEGADGIVGEDQREFLHTIIDQGEDILSVTETIEVLSRIERGDVRLVMEPCAPDTILEAAFRCARLLAEKKDIQVVMELDDAPLPPVSVDLAKMTAVMEQLVSNAVKFTAAGGQVSIQGYLYRESVADGTPIEQLALAVADNGIGIPENEYHRLFEAFYTGHGGPDRQYAGAGVGLAIADAYVQAHNGTITVESVPKRGSTFTVLLPVPPAT